MEATERTNLYTRLDECEIELPIDAIMLMGIARNHYDPHAVNRDWGRDYLGQGITAADGNRYMVGQKEIDIDGKPTPCVVLEVQLQAFLNIDKPEYRTLFFPFDCFDNVTLGASQVFHDLR